jgi:hypothetical protein
MLFSGPRGDHAVIPGDESVYGAASILCSTKTVGRNGLHRTDPERRALSTTEFLSIDRGMEESFKCRISTCISVESALVQRMRGIFKCQISACWRVFEQSSSAESAPFIEYAMCGVFNRGVAGPVEGGGGAG